MRILVTGASGYIGFNVALALHRDGHAVLGGVRPANTRGAQRLTAHEISPVAADLTAAESLRAAIQQVDLVVHVAMSPQDPVASDLSLLREIEQIQRARGRRIPLIYTSGFSVYGMHDFDGPLDEQTPIDRASFRGTVETALAGSDLTHATIRPGFVYGMGTTHSPLAHWFGMLDEDEASFYGRRDRRWSWIHVTDLAESYRILVENIERHSEQAFCVIEDEPVVAHELFQRVLEVGGFSGRLNVEEIGGEASDLQIFNRHEVGDNRKAKRELDWEPRQANVLQNLTSTLNAWRAARRSSI